jgi:tetratricopeptide (TPR) repeat protein
VATYRDWQRPSQLWQFPLLLVSFGLFAIAGFFFIHPYRAATFEDKIDVARHYLAEDRPDAAIEQLNRMLAPLNLLQPQEAQVHLMLAEALEAGQKRLKLNIPENYRRIIYQTELGLAQGATADAQVHRRLAESYAALEETAKAVDHYRLAIALESGQGLDLRRKMIELLIDDQQTQPASEAIDEYLAQKDLAGEERSWALSQKADLLIEERQFEAARRMLTDALKLSTDPVEEGQLNYQLGFCSFREGDLADAERQLRLARDEMKPTHPLDGDAAYFLGRIYQERKDPATALSLYAVTLLSHPDSRQSLPALLGRGMCRIMLGQIDAGLTDLHDVTGMVVSHNNRAWLRGQVAAGLAESGQWLADAKNYQAALECMTYEQQIDTVPDADFYARLGEIYTSRALQLEQSADAGRYGQQVSELRTKAGDAFVAYSRALTLVDDKGYGDALWHGIDLYDSAGNLQRVISALELFTSERPSDKLAPDALLRLGRAYQAAGMYDKAIDCFQRDQLLYPNSIAASKSAVPLAEAFVARGPESYPQAEKVLLGVVEDNDLVDPSAEEFHQSLLELAQLYYRTQRYEQAIARLEEMVQRYPDDQELPRLTFLMADSYRKSALLLGRADRVGGRGERGGGGGGGGGQARASEQGERAV